VGAPGASGRYGFGFRAEAPSPTLAGYADPDGVADMVRVALVVNAVVSVCVAAFAISYLSALDGVGGAGFGALGDIQTAARRLDVGDGISFWAWVLCAVVFIVWTHRAYRNLEPLGASGLRYRSGWAIAGWLVPILAIWRPKQLLNDTWRASDPGLPGNASRADWGSRSTPLLMTAWWVLWIVGAFADRVSVRLGDNSLDSARTTLGIRVGGAACLAAAAVLGVLVVNAITERQQERARQLHELGGFGAVTPAPGPAPEAPSLPA
jgi:uncharacterized protein DUF4328